VLSRSLIVAGKEVLDHVRDTRSVASAALYALMGPVVVLVVLVAARPSAAPPQGQPWTTMAAVFALMAAFTGAMSIATDMIAGERERRSLLPLVASTPSSRPIIVGKWLASTAFATAGLGVTIVAFCLVFAAAGMPLPDPLTALSIAPALVSLAPLAAALEIYISTRCRSTKEANTYLSMLTFVVMGAAMWLAFRPGALTGWWSILPLAGQQRLLEAGFAGATFSLVQSVTMIVTSAALTMTTGCLTLAIVAAAWRSFSRHEAVYGG
jgi:sodium transport system permease protein